MRNLIAKAKSYLPKIKAFIVKVYSQLDWYFRAKGYREFVVTKSAFMPTLKGMKTFGQIRVGQIAIFVSDNNQGYRTIKPIMLRKHDRDDFEVYTEHINFSVRRIK